MAARLNTDMNMSFKDWLHEAIVDQSGKKYSAEDIDEVLKSRNDLKREDIYVTFTNINKFGINPRAVPSNPPTPTGAIYAYPASYLFQMGVYNIPFPVNELKSFLWFFRSNKPFVEINDPNNINYLKQYAEKLGSTYEAEHQKLLKTSVDQKAHQQMFQSNLDKWHKQGYRGAETPGSGDYFDTFPDKKPENIPFKLYAKQGPGQSMVMSDPEQEKYNRQTRSYISSGRKLGDRQKQLPIEDIFWWMPFMWANGNTARWGQIYREMGISGIVDKSWRIHQGQPTQVAVFDVASMTVVDHFDLQTGKNDYNKHTVRKHGEVPFRNEEGYKQGALTKLFSKLAFHIDYYLANFRETHFGAENKWLRNDDYLMEVDRWGKKFDTLLRKIHALTQEDIKPKAYDYQIEKLNNYKPEDFPQSVWNKIEQVKKMIENH